MASKKIYLTTEFLPVVRAYTAKPNKPFNEGDKPKYELQLEATSEQLEAWKDKVKTSAEEAGATFKTKKPKWGVSVREEDESESIKAKSEFKPVVVDAKNNPLVDPKIGPGSIVRAKVALGFYDKGVNLYLQSIQIKKLVEYEGSSGPGFDETDGYEAPEEQRGFPEEEGEDGDGKSPLDL